MTQIVEIVSKDSDRNIGLDASKMVVDDNSSSAITLPSEAPKKRGPGRPRNDGSSVTYTDIVTEDRETAKRKKNNYESQLEKGYTGQAALLMGSVGQADNIYNNVENELEKYRTNKSYGGKTRQMTVASFLSTQVAAIGAKVNAVRELNSMRHKINDLVMKKEQMMKDSGEENSDKRIQDAFYALVNSTRYGLPSFNPPLAQSSINTGVNLSGAVVPSAPIAQTPQIITAGVSGNSLADQQYEAYKQNLNPIQSRMLAEKNPNIKTVVLYDQTTGNKAFDVVDVSTGQSVPGIQRPANFLLDNMRPDFINGIATNSNANLSYPMVLVGNRAADEL